MILHISIYLFHIGYTFGALSDTLNVLAPNIEKHTQCCAILLKRKYQC